MAKTGRKTQEMRHVSFRMPADVHQEYVAIAESRGVDLSALLNWIVIEYRPMLLLKHAQNRAGMLRAAVIGLPQNAGIVPDAQEALTKVKELMDQLQGVASTLSQLASGEQRREAV